MTDASGGKAPSPDRRPPWIDRGRDWAGWAGPRLKAGVRTTWARLLPALQRLWAAADGDVPSPSSDETHEHRELSYPIVVAAKGHVFTFTVRAVLTWSITGERPEVPIWYVRHFTPKVIQQLRRAAADCARDFAPHRAGDLEAALQKALTGQDPKLWRYTRGRVTVQCRPEVWWVRHDDRVLQTLRPHWDRMIELECEYELYLARARYAEDLNRRWMTILDEMLDDPPGGEEAEAINEELSRARRHMAAEQRAAAQWSAELLRDRRNFDQIFEPFTAIPIVPQQAAGPDRDPSGDAPKATSGDATAKATSTEAASKATSSEGTDPKATPAEGTTPERGQDGRR
ncbi:hypothetical protein [Micromonospora sp. CB01531]|uniref:hypothetical protein n=1 Tax=Micromonospora sp. CB01531 TaxID=1718947 RepID=UPI00093BB8D9|nr:hypothetical protein [Micromonospora sp. CB01531]